jgi:hypothetical protein
MNVGREGILHRGRVGRDDRSRVELRLIERVIVECILEQRTADRTDRTCGDHGLPYECRFHERKLEVRDGLRLQLRDFAFDRRRNQFFVLR